MTHFKIESIGPPPGLARLTSREKLTAPDFAEIANRLGVKPVKARKTGFASAQLATKSETIITLWNGKETSNVAAPGDWIVTNMDGDQNIMRDADGNENRYVVRAEKFPMLYESVSGATAFGDVYRSQSTVDALFFPGGFEIMAPWGTMQNAKSGYVVLNIDEVYGNETSSFKQTYKVIA